MHQQYTSIDLPQNHSTTSPKLPRGHPTDLQGKPSTRFIDSTLHI
jgi:hypothetical protein